VAVVYRLARVTGVLARTAPEDAPTCDRVWLAVEPLPALFDAGFGAVARHAGASLEVHLALQEALGSLTRLGREDMAAAARAAAADALRRGLAAIADPEDRARLAAAAAG
jgi:uncharacterized membrane protein